MSLFLYYKPMPKLWIAVCQTLESIMTIKESNEITAMQSIMIFNAAKCPAISIKEYIERLYKYCRCSDTCIVLAFIYIKRLLKKHPDLRIYNLNIHRYT